VVAASLKKQERQAFRRAYYATVLKGPKDRVSLPLILGSAAISGSFTFGVADWGLGALGIRW